MTTSAVMGLLQCSRRHVYDLRQMVYPSGHEHAGEPVLGMTWRIGRCLRFNERAVWRYKAWLAQAQIVQQHNGLFSASPSRAAHSPSAVRSSSCGSSPLAAAAPKSTAKRKG